jgi:hypothetical protein
MENWPQLATTDPDVIDDWWRNGYAGFGVGIATGPGSGVWVLDVDDNGNDKRGEDTLAELVAEHGPLPETPVVLSPGGGRHLYFRWPGFDLTASAGAAGEWLDVRADGNQCCAPPTAHPSGRRYIWEESSRLSKVPFVDAPGWLLERVRAAPVVAVEGDDRCGPVLLAAGFTLGRIDNKFRAHWTRPGKDARDGTSATVYPWPDHHAVIWSTSVPGVDAGRPYGPNELGRLLGAVETVESPAGDRRYIVRRADTVTPERPEWIWPGYLARNIFQVGIGRQGGGKSTFASWVVGQSTTGHALPGGRSVDAADCLYLSMEESDGRVVARLKANGADLSKVVVMDRTLVDGMPWRLPGAASVLEQAIGDYRVRLAIVDGVGYCVEGKQDYPNVAACCSLLASVAERTGSTILGLTHPPKGQSDPVTAAIGSTAWTAVPRLTWLIGRDPDDESQRVVRVGKTAFLEPDAGVGFVIDNDRVWDVGKVRITGTSTVPKAALVAGLQDPREQSTRDEIAELLTEWTESGPIDTDEVRRRLLVEGYSVHWHTVQRAARKASLTTSAPKVLGGPRSFERAQT